MPTYRIVKPPKRKARIGDATEANVPQNEFRKIVRSRSWLEWVMNG
jgi:hypothetical protein